MSLPPPDVRSRSWTKRSLTHRLTSAAAVVSRECAASSSCVCSSAESSNVRDGMGILLDADTWPTNDVAGRRVLPTTIAGAVDDVIAGGTLQSCGLPHVATSAYPVTNQWLRSPSFATP